MSKRTLKLIVTVALAWACFILAVRAMAGGGLSIEKRPLPLPVGHFSPSNARTSDGKLIPAEHFFPASRCASCHNDTHTAWSESLHRNAASEPFYRESADILLRAEGIEFTRHCESCHTPVALFSGALTRGSGSSESPSGARGFPFTPLDDEGVTCSVCHSITEARLDGTGSYTIRRPALLERKDGTPVFGNLSDEEILADIPAHKRAVMRPLLKEPEFCATCHKATSPPELNGYKSIRGFSAYDEWQQSGASHESVTPFYRREQRADCRACHMPKVESANDRAAKHGMIASHRWPGANTAAPLFYGQMEQVRLTERFLKAKVLDIDIFAIRNEATRAFAAALDDRQTLSLKPGEEITAEVVVSNAGAAHSFPPEIRDLYEAWVEFEAIDSTGKAIFHSGFIKSDGMLDESAHVYKSVLLDESGRPITRHQIWLTNIKAYDNTILPGRSDVVRFRFRLPTGVKESSALTLRARVNYRRFNQEYTRYVLERQGAQLSVPIVRMAEATIKVRSSDSEMRNRTPRGGAEDASRWNDYGIGLLEQSQYGAAAEAFRRASELDPNDPDLMVNAAIAEMKTERFGPEREQFGKAAHLLDCALRIDPAHGRARFFKALVWRGSGKAREAAEELSRLAREYPRDREVQRQLGQTLYAIGRLAEARAAFEAVAGIDPTDAGAYQYLAPIYAGEGRKAEADRARALYLEWRDDPLADGVAARFFAAHPEWAEERTGPHVHSKDSARRAVLTGKFAAPDM